LFIFTQPSGVSSTSTASATNPSVSNTGENTTDKISGGKKHKKSVKKSKGKKHQKSAKR
jgi:hypothetical protein